MAVASLVLGIISVISWCFGIVPGILAIIFALQAKKELREKPWMSGAGMATAGLVLGIVGVVLAVFIFIMYFVAVAALFSAMPYCVHMHMNGHIG